jgi:hypothetical protein
MPPVLSRALDPEAMTDLEPDFDVYLLNSSNIVEATNFINCMFGSVGGSTNKGAAWIIENQLLRMLKG